MSLCRCLCIWISIVNTCMLGIVTDRSCKKMLRSMPVSLQTMQEKCYRTVLFLDFCHLWNRIVYEAPAEWLPRNISHITIILTAKAQPANSTALQCNSNNKTTKPAIFSHQKALGFQEPEDFVWLKGSQVRPTSLFIYFHTITSCCIKGSFKQSCINI